MQSTSVTLGIDIGGTNTALGFVSAEGVIFHSTSIPTQAEQSADEYFPRLIGKIREQIKLLPDSSSLKAVGIGAPNANYYSGAVELPPNLNWGTVNVVNTMKQHFDIPVVITNDANAAALGEMIFGVAKGMQNFVMITLGTGLGSGIVVNGKLVYGHDGFAGEVGHTIVDPNGRMCGCGRRGCLETYVSASGIKRTVFELLAQSTEQSSMRSKSFDELTSFDVFQAATNSDPIALEAFDQTAKVLALKLADTVAHLSPEAIVLFGGLAQAGSLILEPIKKYLEQYVLNIFKNKVQVLQSGLSEGSAAILGSAALAWEEISQH